MENKNQNGVIIIVAVVFLLIGGSVGYFFMKYQTMTSQLDEIKRQETGQVSADVDAAAGSNLKEDGPEESKSNDSESVLPESSAPGDVGENPPPETTDWPIYEDVEHNFHFQYPDHYETVVDNYGWPHAVVHLIDKSGGQSYDVTFETWDGQDDAANEGRGSSANSFFGNSESPHTGKYISMTCWNPGLQEDCEKIYSTFSFQ